MYMYACIVHCWGPHGGWAIWLNGLPSGNKDFIIIIIIISHTYINIYTQKHIIISDANLQWALTIKGNTNYWLGGGEV